MKHEIVAVYDLAGEMWSRPYFVPTIGLAIRSFSDEVNRNSEDNAYYKHPGDYNLFHIGTWDDTTGDIVQADRRLLIRGIEAHAKQTLKEKGN